MNTLGDDPIAALDVVRRVMEEDGTVAAYIQAGKIDLALDLIERTIIHFCRDRSYEVFLDPSDRRISDRLAQRIIRHPLFAFDEKETMLQVLGDPVARAGMEAILANADLLLRATAERLLLLLTPEDQVQ